MTAIGMALKRTPHTMTMQVTSRPIVELGTMSPNPTVVMLCHDAVESGGGAGSQERAAAQRLRDDNKVRRVEHITELLAISDTTRRGWQHFSAIGEAAGSLRKHRTWQLALARQVFAHNDDERKERYTDSKEHQLFMLYTHRHRHRGSPTIRACCCCREQCAGEAWWQLAGVPGL